MNKDRLVQLVALGVAVGCLIGTTMLSPRIRDQREELNLTFTLDSDRGQPPKYALTAAAMGSFRGIVVDILWYRIEHFKREGKIHEANTLATWITTLQPRFAQVWIFQAWNMAYNISVMTHTPEERWMWVKKGVDLLREEGIPNNSTVIGIYDQLGWIFYHKIGQYLDDHHWYYKEQLARNWQILLGSQRQGATPEQVVADFKPIADAADQYFQLDEPSQAAREKLRELMPTDPGAPTPDPELAQILSPLWSNSLGQFIENIPRTAQRLREEGYTEAAREIETLLEGAQQRRQRSRNEPLKLLKQEASGTEAILQTWNDLGLGLDEAGLRTFGELKMYADRLSARELIRRNPPFLSENDLAILEFMDEHWDDPALAKVLAFLRAKVLLEDYVMRPRDMYQMMKEFGPLDWRHHASHAFYWYMLGMWRGDAGGDGDKFDLLTVHRQAKNSLQNLVFTGQLTYDPFARSVHYAPDPGYFEEFEAMTETAMRRVRENSEYNNSVTGFESGHENLLQKLVLYSYIYGSEEQATKYYTKVRRLYNHKWHNQESRRYDQPLDDFIVHVLARDQGMMQVSPPFIQGMIQRGLIEGLAQGRLEVFEKFLGLARQMHAKWQETRGYEQPNTVRGGRMMIGTFDEVLVETYAGVMSAPDISVYHRMQIYRNTPESLQRRAYGEFSATVQRHATQQGFDASLAFPPPENLDEQAPLEIQRPESAASETVERN